MRTIERLLTAAAAVLLVLQAIVVVTHRPDGPPASVAIEDVPPPEPSPSASPTPPVPDPVLTPEEPPTPTTEAPTTGAPPAPAEVQTQAEVRQIDPGASADEGPPPPPRSAEPPPPPPSDEDRSPPRDPAYERFARDFPDQEAAGQDPRDPSTTRWAVLIGINDHYGPTRDNVGSRQDAEDLHSYLLHLGWRSDHIVLLTDHAATRERIEQAIWWLARKTNGDSVAAFHYSGHTKQWHGWDPDRDGEVPDEALWPADNDRMTDRELVDRLAHVRAGRFWIDIGACEAEGYADPGMLQDGRVLTFSSREAEKSYEDPSVSNSVWGYYLVERGMHAGEGDADGDGDVTVQEAFDFAAPRAAQRTANGRNGPQHPVIQDRAGPFSLRIPPPPPPPPSEEPSDDRDDGGDPDDDGEDCGLPICTGAWTRGTQLSW